VRNFSVRVMRGDHVGIVGPNGYYARMHGPWPIPAGRTMDVPTGYAQFPREIIRPPRSLAARTYSDIQRWSVMPRGGHFAALEQPEALANEVREFFRPLWRR
jgi:pimeloyl-ACP methyl ester carboxylesterase